MADKALAWGIVNFVAEPKEFNKVVDDIAAKLAGGAPIAQKLAKGLLYYGAQADQRTALYLEAAVSGDIALTKDLNEGLTAHELPPPAASLPANKGQSSAHCEHVAG